MQKYCIDEQIESAKKLAPLFIALLADAKNFPDRPITEFEMMHILCVEQGIEENDTMIDWSMVRHCLIEQFDALSDGVSPS